MDGKESLSSCRHRVGGNDHYFLQILSMESTRLKAEYDPAAGALVRIAFGPEASSSVVFGQVFWLGPVFSYFDETSVDRSKAVRDLTAAGGSRLQQDFFSSPRGEPMAQASQQQ